MLSILDELSSNAGRNDKIGILQKNKDNKDLKEFFHLALDPMVTFGIKKIPKYTPNRDKGISLAFAFDSLSDLSSRRVTGNAGIAHLLGMLEALNYEDAQVIERIIEKDPKCGVAESSVNKVWDKLVFEFPVMKASPYDEKTITNISYPAFSQKKLDGARCCLVVRPGCIIALSSSGREIITHGQFDWLKQVVFKPVVFDGELLVTEPTGNFMERKKGNGIVNKAVKGTIPVDQAKQLHFVCFDVVPEEAWLSGEFNVPYTERFKNLLGYAKQFKHNASVVDTLMVDSELEAVKHFKKMLSDGEEGTILKDAKSIWEGKRRKDHIKFKSIITADFKVIAVEEGTGKNKGKIGALVCQSKDGLVEVNVGTGLTDADRAMSYDFFVGKVVEVAYNERIINKTEGSKWSLFLPRFLRVRIDKDEADTIDNIPLKG